MSRIPTGTCHLHEPRLIFSSPLLQAFHSRPFSSVTADADPIPKRGQATHYPAAQPAAPAPGPQSAIPNFGGRAPDGTAFQQSQWGVDKVPTPREMVAMLDQYVVGQAQAKKILSVGVHNHFKRVAHDMERQRAAMMAQAAATGAAAAGGGPAGSGSGQTGTYMPLSGGMLPGDPEQYLQLSMMARTDPVAVSKFFWVFSFSFLYLYHK